MKELATLCMTVVCMTAFVIAGCIAEKETKPLVDWDSVGPTVVVEDATAAAPIAEVDPIDGSEPPGASVPLGPSTDTVSVADETGRLPGDVGFKGEIEPPTKIYVVTSPENCPPCKVLENDNAPQELKNKWPSALVKIVRPNTGEVVPMLKIEHNGRWYYLPGFYPMPKTHPTREQRLEAMFEEIRKKLNEVNQ